MRVSVLTYTLGYGAFSAIATNIARGLSAAGVEMDILYLNGPPPDQFDHSDGIELIRLGGRSRTCWIGLARHLRRRRPDALISLGWILNPTAVVAAALARTTATLVLNEQSLLSYKTRIEHRGQLNLRVLGALARVLYLRADAVTGASRPIVDDLERQIGINPKRVLLDVVPNAVDVDSVRVRALQPDPEAVTAASGPVFVSVARHARQKNIALLIRAFERYLAGGGTGTLVLVGEGPQTPELQKLVADRGLASRVVFRGRLSNPFPQMAAATAFVLSSEEEGFGLVLVEAMAVGTPVISTDCPGGPREVLADGRAGMLVPPGDDVALAVALAQVAGDPALQERLERAGSERATDFTPQVVGRRWLQVLDRARHGAAPDSGASGAGQTSSARTA